MVAPLQVDAGGRSRRKLEHAARAYLPPHDSVPPRQVAIDLLHALAAVEEDGVDGKVHEHHVDAAARVDPHAAAGGQIAAEHQPKSTAEHRARHLEVLGENLPGLFV